MPPPQRTTIVSSDCIEVTGTGDPATPYRLEPVIEQDGCNALACTGNGLRVPRTELAGIDQGANIGPARSVDIDVVDNGGEDCPDTWTIGARLTPVYGRASGQDRTLPLNGEWTPTNCVATLPEPGVYMVTAMAVGQICATARYSTNVWITFGLQRDGSGFLFGSGLVQHQYGFPPAGNGYQACHAGQGSVTAHVVVGDQANVRVVGRANGRVAPESTVQSIRLRAPRISWHKISD
ncbi:MULTISPECIES: hypothetical protein [Streptomyces]|uniref:hypothetical protein n=1 Tax=Streptomyces lycopersici TaxID=2974589 RepID=UPI0021CF4EC6|nr:hypothetical protein [Streptomyces sp. NEAU-383]